MLLQLLCLQSPAWEVRVANALDIKGTTQERREEVQKLMRQQGVDLPFDLLTAEQLRLMMVGGC